MKIVSPLLSHRLFWVGGISLALFILQYFLIDRSLATISFQTDIFGLLDQPIDFLQLPLSKLILTLYHIVFLALCIFGVDRIYGYIYKPKSSISSETTSSHASEVLSNTMIHSPHSSSFEQPNFAVASGETKKTSRQEILEFLSPDDETDLIMHSTNIAATPKQFSQGNLSKHIQVQVTELERLIGLKQVKTEIHSILNFIKVNQLRAESGLITHDISYHMVFTGNPGTGKTSVARILARIFKELGILSKGHLIETDRAGLVAGFVGQTALKVKEVVDSAKGGVLFIDEAYTLANPSSSNDYGKEAIDTLLKYMEDYREDFIVIVAGYSDVMKDFIHSNPGLKSRFNRYVYFSDYNAQEMLDILYLMSQKVNYVYSPEAEAYVLKFFGWVLKQDMKNFGNGRGVRNLFETIITIHANRMSQVKNPSQVALSSIVVEDVVEAIKKITQNKL